MNGKEIEIKLMINESDYFRLVDFLKNNAIYKNEKHQIDVYYSPKDESFYDCGDRCLRVRTEGNISIFSFKRIHDVNTNKQFIEEYETSVESAEILDQILKALNYRSEITVDKYRIEYFTETGFLIAFDKVKELGFFVEIENQNEFDTLEKRNQDLLNFVQHLHLDITRRNTEGYSNMLFRKKHQSGDD